YPDLQISHTSTNTHTHTHTHKCTHTSTNAHTHTQMHTHTHTHTQAQMCTHTHTHKCTKGHVSVMSCSYCWPTHSNIPCLFLCCALQLSAYIVIFLGCSPWLDGLFI